jgi:hypothetical protein
MNIETDDKMSPENVERTDYQSVACPSECVAQQEFAATIPADVRMLGTECTGNGAAPALAESANTVPSQSGRPSAGAPLQNVSAAKHGLYGIGWPKGTAHYRKRVAKFTLAIEAAIIAAHGEVTIEHAALCQTAARWERHALLAAYWLRSPKESLSIDQRLALSRDVARAGTERDRCLKLLELNARQQRDPWANLDSYRAALSAPHAPAAPTGDKPAWQAHHDQAHEVSTSGGTEPPSSQGGPNGQL